MLVKQMSGLSLNGITCHLLIAPSFFLTVSACFYACACVLTFGGGLQMFSVLVWVTLFLADDHSRAAQACAGAGPMRVWVPRQFGALHMYVL